MTNTCFECGEPAEFQHHVVPKSRGGTKTVPLCGACHGKAHFWDKRMSTGELTREALSLKKKRGEKTGGDVPYGFDCVGGKLLPNLEEQKVFKIMVNLRYQGFSLRSIAQTLLSWNLRPRNGGKWHAQTIKQTLESRHLLELSQACIDELEKLAKLR